jgi:hypothetical protein
MAKRVDGSSEKICVYSIRVRSCSLCFVREIEVLRSMLEECKDCQVLLTRLSDVRWCRRGYEMVFRGFVRPSSM